MNISTPSRDAIATRARRSRKSRTILSIGFSYVILIGLSSISILPLLWMLSTSLRDTQTLFQFPPEFIPAHPTLANYAALFHQTSIARFFLNSAMVSIGDVLLVVFFGALGGYAFAQLPFPGRNLIFYLLLGGLMIPFEVLIVPLFVVIVRIHWVNTYQGIILPMAAAPLGLFIMRQFLLSMPAELLDAARIDGSSEFGIFWRVVLPLAKPALAALSTLTFLGAWNAFLWPLIATTKESLRVLPLAIALLQLQFTGIYGMMMAMATLTFVPPLIMFVVFQRYFVQGIALSGIKG